MYRYGFNGQENSDEIKGSDNSYTAEFWEYDPRAGRRWNLDPKPSVGISQYSAFNGNPIWFSDPFGDTTINGQKYQGKDKAHADNLAEVIFRCRCWYVAKVLGEGLPTTKLGRNIIPNGGW